MPNTRTVPESTKQEWLPDRSPNSMPYKSIEAYNFKQGALAEGQRVDDARVPERVALW